MAIAPYTPTPFASPVVNPAVGGSGQAFPYISSSEYTTWPTGMDVSSLVVGAQDSGPAAQMQALADLIDTASRAADEICFGADPASKGASLCATVSVETDTVQPRNGTLRLFCDYKPIVQVNGVDIGFSMASLTTVGPVIASQIHIARRTIHVPMFAIATRANDTGTPPGTYGPGAWQGGLSVVWSYVNGYPHTYLTAPITAGQDTCTVAATDGGTGLLGIIANQTQLRIVDGAQSETFTVSAVSGTTLTASAPFVSSHALPAAPDFVPVTALPPLARRAVIYLTTALIKSQGNDALILAGPSGTKSVEKNPGNLSADVTQAMRWLEPYRVTVKRGRH